MKTLYSFAHFDGVDVGGCRIGGPGLGNNLFPWARAAVFSRVTGAQEIRPTWPQINPRRMARRDSDQRHYHGVPCAEDEITALQKYRLLVTQRRLDAHTVAEGLAHVADAGVVHHLGMQGLFEELLPWQGFLRQRFLRLMPTLARHDLDSAIVAHVRRGDFRTSGSATIDMELLHRGEANVQIPDEWFEHAIAEARALVGSAAPTFIVSDAPPVQLEGITRATGARVASSASPWQDLHTLIGAGVRIGAGSTFSDWAAFLATGPTIMFRGQNRLGPGQRVIEL